MEEAFCFYLHIVPLSPSLAPSLKTPSLWGKKERKKKETRRIWRKKKRAQEEEKHTRGEEGETETSVPSLLPFYKDGTEAERSELFVAGFSGLNTTTLISTDTDGGRRLTGRWADRQTDREKRQPFLLEKFRRPEDAENERETDVEAPLQWREREGVVPSEKGGERKKKKKKREETSTRQTTWY